jgi:hypothetical protein
MPREPVIESKETEAKTEVWSTAPREEKSKSLPPRDPCSYVGTPALGTSRAAPAVVLSLLTVVHQITSGLLIIVTCPARLPRITSSWRTNKSARHTALSKRARGGAVRCLLA